MKKRSVMLCGVSLVTSTAFTDSRTTTLNYTGALNWDNSQSHAPQTCSPDCQAVMHSAALWVFEKHSIPARRVFLDTVRTGRTGYQGAQLVPHSVISALSNSIGFAGHVDQEKVSECFSPLVSQVPANCQAYAEKLFLTLFAPIMNASTPNQASLVIMKMQGASALAEKRGSWDGVSYRLILERGAQGWRVIAAKDTVYF